MHRTVIALSILVLATAALAAEPTEPTFRVNEHERGQQLVGEVIRADIDRQFPEWDAEYVGYDPAPEALATLAAVDGPLDIVCVLGTWCHDSEREVPRFWKILDAADNPNLGLTMYAVGRTDDEEALVIEEDLGFAESLRATWQVELVPTFVFLRDGEEIGRIVETPATTLEEDAAALVAEAPASTWH